MNLESMPSTKFYLEQDGYLPVEWQNFFSINNQNMKLFFSNTGHLVPSRTNADITTLSNAGMTDPTLYLARSLYNNDTSNFMGNVAGTYLNYTMHSFYSQNQLLKMSHPTQTIRYMGDENNNLYVSVNGTIGQVPRVTSSDGQCINFEVDGNDIYAVINGNRRKVLLEGI